MCRKSCTLVLLLCWAASLVIDAERASISHVEKEDIVNPALLAMQRQNAERQKKAAEARKKKEEEAHKRKKETDKCRKDAVETGACSKPCSTGFITLVNEKCQGSNREFKVPCNQHLCHEDRWKQKTIQKGALRRLTVSIADQNGPLGNEIPGAPTCHFEVLTPDKTHITTFSITGEGRQEAELDGSFVEEGSILRWRGCELAMQGDENQLLKAGSESVDVDGLEVDLDMKTEFPTAPGTIGPDSLKVSVDLPHIIVLDFAAPEAHGDPIIGYDVEASCGHSPSAVMEAVSPQLTKETRVQRLSEIMQSQPIHSFVLSSDAKQVELTGEELLVPNTGCVVTVTAKNHSGRAETFPVAFKLPEPGCEEGEKCCEGPGLNDYECIKKEFRLFRDVCSDRPGWHGSKDTNKCGHNRR
eukprot:TRINITY_DN8697_c0_g1_i5.p1 TRINITY_DN8697_c0_g1~~TRINITY_DN8697_c0_g1_i5.p1  ORF type:complete len:414 (+),score=76.32 TRINITY_DN8697_c0_g1_i5:55-1296(+)